jgi:diguanylate cyclase (GGDEF)-like protein/PAS domain S-box-containing protein
MSLSRSEVGVGPTGGGNAANGASPSHERAPRELKRARGGLRGRAKELVGSRYVQMLLVVAVYFGAAKAGLGLAGSHQSITAVWPPTGVALAAVLLLGYRIWPGIAAGAFFANITTAGPFLSVLGITAGNTLEALVGAYLLLSVAGFDRTIDRVRDVVALLCAALLATTVSATIGVASLWAGDLVSSGDLGSSWRVWWLGDATGALIVTPAILILARPRPVPRGPAAITEAVLLGLLLAGTAVLAFTTSWAWPYMIFPVVFWVAIRFRQPGAVVGSLVLAAIAVWFTARDHGPFAGGSLDSALLSEQAYVATVALTALITAVVVTERQRLRDALHRLSRSELSLAEAEEAASLGRWEWDVQSDEVRWSDELYRIYGLEPGKFEASFEGYLERVHEEDRFRVGGLIRDALEAQRPFSFEERIVRPSGEVRRLLSRGQVVTDGSGNAIRMMGVCRDITELRETESAMQEAQARFQNAFDHAPIGIALIAIDDGHFLEVNDAICQITGYSRDELLARDYESLIHPADRRARHERIDALRIEKLLSGGPGDGFASEQRFIDSSGDQVWVQTSSSLVRGQDGGALYRILQVQDINSRKAAEDKLHHLADHDPLTGLFNRRRLLEDLESEISRSHRYEGEVAVLVVDLDRFKYVNDALGHALGDELIARVAEILRTNVREGDVVARLGGDEFAVILPQTDREAAVATAQKVLDRIREEAIAVSPERTTRVTASVGVSLTHEFAVVSGEELLAAADLAMYHAKETGRDRMHVRSPDDNTDMRKRLGWSERVRDALENDRFVLQAQPIMDLATGDIARHELLLRMVDEGRLIRPGAFLYVAEEFGMIQAIDKWVLSEAVRLVEGQAELGERLSLEVNLSGSSITDEEVLEHIESELSTSGIDPSSLIFEVTETAAITNIERARQFAARIEELGCAFALDDFGTGFGSFYYLKHLPFDYLKIDGDFIADLPRNQADRLTVQAIVEIARGMGKKTIAEFVESEEVLTLLRALGVDFAQGFRIGRPDDLVAFWDIDAPAARAATARREGTKTSS